MKKVISYKLWVTGLGMFLAYNLALITNNLCYAQPLSSTVLIDNAAEYDGKTVSYEGEVIGDIMRRGSYAWLNVNDGRNAIGIWLDTALLKGVSLGGSYKTRGDIVEVTGIFRRACLQHGGDLDIHAQSLQKKMSGRLTMERINLNKRNLALILMGILGLIWTLRILRRR